MGRGADRDEHRTNGRDRMTVEGRQTDTGERCTVVHEGGVER
ncbi:MAG: hypothetical protein ACRDTG_15610 [Pseudonocardiaceae bacterium]